MKEIKKLEKKTIRKQTTIKAYGNCGACSCSCAVAPSESTASSQRYQGVSTFYGT